MPRTRARHRRALRLVASALVVLLVVSGCAVAYVGYRVADAMIHPGRNIVNVTPRDFGLPYRDLAFSARDRVPLVGWWMPATNGTPRGTVVVLHGYGANRGEALGVAPFLHSAGYNVLAFDFRGQGQSGGDHTTLGLDEVRDVGGALDWLGALPNATVGPVALLGFSMGGATAINAAPVFPEVRAVIVDSAFATALGVAMRAVALASPIPSDSFGSAAILFAAGMIGHFPSDDEPVREAALLARPLLVIQGLGDALSPPADSGIPLCHAAGSWCTLWEVPHAGHVGALDAAPHEYEARVLGFLSANLPAPRTVAR